MYAIPRHLSKIFRANRDSCDEHNLNGEIRCDCGCERFRIKIFAGMDNRSEPEVCECGEDWALVIKIVCVDCKKEWLLFDLSKHGYDGYVCHEGVTVPDSELQPYTCPGCGEDIFEIEVGIEVEDREQFKEEIVQEEPEHFSEEDYVDAFNWITINLKCPSCDKSLAQWIDLELS